MLINNEIPDLIGGVSQQAPLLRFPNQADEQINCSNSPIAGMSKRPHSKLVTRLDATEGEMMDMKTHFMFRDKVEQYVFGVSDNRLRVYDIKTGYSYPVENTPEYYLDNGSTPSREAFKFLSLGDDTYILNTSIPPQMDYTKFDDEVDVKKVKDRYKLSFKTSIGLDKSINNTESLRYATRFVIEGRVKGAVHVGSEVVEYDFPYKLDGNPYSNGVESIQMEMVSKLERKGIKAWREGFYVVIEVDGGTTANVEDISAFKVGHTTGKFQIPTGTESWIQHNYVSLHSYGSAVETASGEKPHAYLWIKQTDYAVTYTVKINGYKSQIETPEATSDRAREGLNTEALTQRLSSNINNNKHKHGCISEIHGNTIKIYHTQGADFELEVTDGLYNAALKAVKGVAQSKKELPPNATEESVIKVSGETDSENNGYYVRFNPVTQVWEETVKKGLANYIKPESMPHIIRRLQKDEYVTPSNPYGIFFKVETVDWKPRAVGDENTVTIPSFISEQDEEGRITAPRYITTMAFYRGRLWFLGGDYASSSVVNDRHNFFQSTAILVSDDDPIDGFIDLTEHAETIHSATPTDSGLLVFTSRAQYLITSQGLLSPITFEFKQVSTYASDSRVTPQPISDRVAFITQRSDYAALQESFVLDTLMQRSASDLTSHVPEYVYGNVHNILAASTVNTMFLIMRDLQGNAVDTVYVYDFLRDGNKRVQSSWSKWQFQGQVIDGVLTQEAVYFIIRRQHFYENEEGEQKVDEWYNMERIDLITDEVRNELGHPVFLDALQVSDEEPQDLKQGEVKKRFQGKWYRGYPYQQYYKFSPFFLRPQNSKTGETGGRLQLRRLTLNFDKTTSFHLTVETLGRETREIFFQGRVLGDVRNIIGKVPVVDGKRTFPLLGSSESISVSIRNDSVFDARFQSGYWEGVYHNRARRF